MLANKLELPLGELVAVAEVPGAVAEVPAVPVCTVEEPVWAVDGFVAVEADVAKVGRVPTPIGRICPLNSPFGYAAEWMLK